MCWLIIINKNSIENVSDIGLKDFDKSKTKKNWMVVWDM